MSIAASILQNATGLAEAPGDAVTSFLRLIGERTGLFGDGMGGGMGFVTSSLAGIAAALAVAIALTLYVGGGGRGARGLMKGIAAVVAVLGLVSFVAYDMHHASLAYLGINPSKPALQFEIRLPRTALSAFADAQVELHTDRNQKLAQLRGTEDSEDGRSVIRGSVTLDYRTTERVVILSLPDRGTCAFKLRLAASPSRSDQFGPWHLADRIETPAASHSEALDAFAIRYRVL
jgi:hypothetical protein